MRIWLAKELKEQDVNNFLNMNATNLAKFFLRYKRIIKDCGAYIKLDNFVLCFCIGMKGNEELYALPAQEVDNKESFDELLNNTSPTPFEFTLDDLNNI